jgi:hypothetical protein
MTPSKLDESKINATATALNVAVLASLPAVLDELFAYNGKPVGEVVGLNPSAPPKRLNGFKIGGGTGAWMNLGTGDSGSSVVDFVEWFGACDHQAAVDLLSRIVTRLEKAAAA